MNMKEANLEAEVDINDDGVAVVFKLIKKHKGQPEEFLKVLITPDQITADLNELSYFALEEFKPNRIDAEIAC
jgi:hypothetical protein